MQLVSLIPIQRIAIYSVDSALPLLNNWDQMNYPDLDTDTSLEWNFCARFSDVTSREDRRWRREMSAVFSD